MFSKSKQIQHTSIIRKSTCIHPEQSTYIAVADTPRFGESTCRKKLHSINPKINTVSVILIHRLFQRQIYSLPWYQSVDFLDAEAYWNPFSRVDWFIQPFTAISDLPIKLFETWYLQDSLPQFSHNASRFRHQRRITSTDVSLRTVTVQYRYIHPAEGNF